MQVSDNGGGGAVLRAVLELGAAPRSLIARHAGLSPATVTTAARRLIQAGLVVELPDTTTAGVGRPFVPLAVNAAGNVALALHIAAQHITVAAVDIAGTLLHHKRVRHTSNDPDQILRTAAAEIAHVRDSMNDSTRIIGLGVATGGWVDTTGGTVIEHGFLGWKNVPVREILSAQTGLHTEIDSHARALVHAEHLFGRERGAASTFALFVGNVIDTAFAVHGQVHYGRRAAAGSIAGLAAGAGGSSRLHQFSDAALSARAVRMGLLPAPDPAELASAAATPHSPANALFVERATALGRMAASLIDLLNPDTFIVSDRAFDAPGVGEAYRAAIRAHSVTGADPGTLVGSSFAGWVLSATAAAVILWPLYASPLTMTASAA